jgi:hypothetical protein
MLVPPKRLCIYFLLQGSLYSAHVWTFQVQRLKCFAFLVCLFTCLIMRNVPSMCKGISCWLFEGSPYGRA